MFWWAIIGFLTGRGLHNAGLPDSVKQERHDRALARRQARVARRQPGRLTTGQVVVLVLVVLWIIGVIVH